TTVISTPGGITQTVSAVIGMPCSACDRHPMERSLHGACTERLIRCAVDSLLEIEQASYCHAGISSDAPTNNQPVGTVKAGIGCSCLQTVVAVPLEVRLQRPVADLYACVRRKSQMKNGGRLHGHISLARAYLQRRLRPHGYLWQNLVFGAEDDYTRIKLNQQHANDDDDLDRRIKGPSPCVKFRF
ncbi:MAG: hypothetical protein ABI129_09225, partial [Rhodanobacter sp.]